MLEDRVDVASVIVGGVLPAAGVTITMTPTVWLVSSPSNTETCTECEPSVKVVCNAGLVVVIGCPASTTQLQVSAAFSGSLATLVIVTVSPGAESVSLMVIVPLPGMLRVGG